MAESVEQAEKDEVVVVCSPRSSDGSAGTEKWTLRIVQAESGKKNPSGEDLPERKAVQPPSVPVKTGGDPGVAESDSAGREDGQTVMVKEIRFEGNTVIASDTLQSLTADFRNKALSWDDILSIADTVTMAYQEKGYILAKAHVPPQKVSDGVLRIVIVEGNVGKIEVTGNKYYHDRVIKRYFRPQVKHRVIRERLLERGLLLTKEIPFVDTRILLKKGEKPGSADVVLDAEDRVGATLGIDYNNFGHRLVGEDRYGFRFEMTDPWWGSTLALRGVTGNAYDDSRLGSAAWTLPLNGYGTRLGFSYMKGNYLIGQELADLGLEGETRIYGVNVSHPFIKTGSATFSATLHYERKYSETFTDGEKSTFDKSDVYGASLDFDNLDRFLGKNIVSLDYSHGRLSPDKEITLSRIEGDRTFDVFRIDVARIQKVYGSIVFMARGSGQLTSDRLVSIEQKVLGGYGSVRGHEPALYLGDNGYTLTGELMFAPPLVADKTLFGQRISQMVQFAFFFDHGGVYTEKLQSGESRSEYLSGYGVGIRLFYKDLMRFKFDVGKPAWDKIKDDKDTYYYFMLDIKFF